jgi:hypothetical protein
VPFIQNAIKFWFEERMQPFPCFNFASLLALVNHRASVVDKIGAQQAS